jgi:hypothetical protein
MLKASSPALAVTTFVVSAASKTLLGINSPELAVTVLLVSADERAVDSNPEEVTTVLVVRLEASTETNDPKFVETAVPSNATAVTTPGVTSPRLTAMVCPVNVETRLILGDNVPRSTVTN